MTLLRRSIFFCACATSSLLGCNAIFADEIPWADSHYYHFAQDQDISSLIHDFTAIQNIDVIIGAPLIGMVNGIFENIPPEEFWDHLSKAYNLAWFYDGSALYVYPGTEVKTEVIPISQQEAVTLKSVVGELDCSGSTVSMRYLPSTRMMVVSGPPRFMEVVQSFLAKIQNNTIQNFADETVVQVFPLKYAFAYDVNLDVGTGNGITIEGVSTLLQRILNGINTIPNVAQDSVAIGGLSPAQLKEGTATQQKSSPSSMSASQSPGNATEHANQIAQMKANAPSAQSIPGKIIAKMKFAGGEEDRDRVETDIPSRNLVHPITSITYDARLNAVIVRDHKDLMPFYQSLIERFDVPTKAVEIKAAIVDVDVGQSRKIGIDVLQFLNGGKELTWRPDAGDAKLTDENANFFGKLPTLIEGYDVNVRLQALESSNAAKTFSRPSVLTLDNIAAVISHSHENYVRVAGAYSAELFTISAKIALRVIPHIVELENSDGTLERKIKLFVSIEDGSMSAMSGSDGMPSVRSSQINTQSILNEGESLVVGGYYKENHQNVQRGVPFLKNIPIIGRLFSSQERKIDTTERLFIISPRIVEISANEGIDIHEKFFHEGNLSGKPMMDMEDFTINHTLKPRR
ncbi:MAG: hypothetical protein LBI69_04530 [Puniceicoccales bacterium]|jgi:type III secretion protein C|nr:hypothetical protein [Puniceicoccales bacterium]